MMGVGWLPGTMGGGYRSTAADYLTDEVRARGNLEVLTGAQVTRVLFEQKEGEEPVAVGIEYAADASCESLSCTSLVVRSLLC